MIKKFIIHSFYFFVILITLVGVGLVLPNLSASKTVDYALLQKHKLLSNREQPALILTGGSNVLFGYDSELISKKLKKPVLNHAIHAGYGLKYILDDLYEYLKPGDTVILSPEYSHFLKSGYLGREPLLYSLTVKPSNLNLLSLSQIFNILPEVPRFSLTRVRSFISASLRSKKNSGQKLDTYKENSINSYGDHYTHWDLEPQRFESYIFNGEFNESSLEYLVEYHKKLKKENIVLVMMYPSLCQSSFTTNKEYIDMISKELNKTDMTIVGQPEDFVYKDSFFFDTPYHLTGKGVRKRSIRTADKIINFNHIKSIKPTRYK